MAVTNNKLFAINVPNGQQQEDNVHNFQHKDQLVAGLTIVFLIVLNLIFSSNILSSYFYCDDYQHVIDQYQLFAQPKDKFIESLFAYSTKSFYECAFWRPFFKLTLTFDYLIWQANPFGFHLTNLLYQIYCSAFLFLVVNRLLKEWRIPKGQAIAFGTAALFSVYPAHSEVLGFIGARVDSVCAAFYLASFWLFLIGEQDKKKWAKHLSVGSFAISLFSKEMAFSLPLMLTLYCFLATGPATSRKDKWSQRLIASLRKTWLFWGTFVVYSAIRAIFLGTMIGGYCGALGDILNPTILTRWLLLSSWSKVAYPFNDGMFAPDAVLRGILRIIYALLGINVLARFFLHPWSHVISKPFLFACAWFVLCMIPTYQVWYISPNLEGARYIYLGSAALCLIMSLIIFAPARHSPENLSADLSVKGILNKVLSSYVSWFLMIALILCYGAIIKGNNQVWLKAGTQVKHLKSAIESTLLVLPQRTKLVILNLPRNYYGVPLFYNWEMLQNLLRQPLCSKNLSLRVAVPEHCSYKPEIVNSARLKRMLRDQTAYAMFIWDEDKLFLKTFAQQLPAPGKLCITIKKTKSLPSDNFEEYQIALDPIVPASAVDFVETELLCNAYQKPKLNSGPGAWLLWQSGSTIGSTSLPLVANGRPYLYRFSVSERKDWWLGEYIDKMYLRVAPNCSSKLLGLKLRTSSNLVPTLNPGSTSTMIEGPDSICRFVGTQSHFTFDVSNIQGADSAIVEISKPNALFQIYTGSYRDTKLSPHALKCKRLTTTRGVLKLSAAEFPVAARYSLRVAALSDAQEVLGYVSDPLYLEVSSKQIIEARKLR